LSACARGVPSFDRIRYRRHDASVFLYAFDLVDLNGDDLRREPLDTRKAPFGVAAEAGRARTCGSTSASRPTRS
jgi:ATP-dependent DNA ligase